MPSPNTTKYPEPKLWDEFEDIVADGLRSRGPFRSGLRQQ